MSFKIEHIKTRFLLQIVFFVLFTLVCISIFWIYSSSVKKIDAPRYKLTLIKNEIHNAQLISRNILMEGVNIGQKKTSYASPLHELEIIEDDFNSLFEISLIKRVLEKHNFNDSLNQALKNCQKSMQYLILSKEELNTQTNGNSNALISLSNNICNSFIPAINSELFSNAIELKNLETEYLFFSKTSAYNDLMTLIENLNYNPQIQKMIMDGNSSLAELLDSYRAKAHQINDIFERIGSININRGQVLTLENDFLLLLNTFENFEHFVSQYIQKRKNISLILFSLLTLLICASYIFIIFFLMKKIRNPLLQAIRATYDLSKGKFSSANFDKEAPYEFSTLNQNLSRVYHAAEEKKNFVDNLLKQKFDADLALQGKSDVFGKILLALKENMQKARAEQTKYSEDNRLRRYMNEGIANFANILRANNNDLDKLSDIFIRELVKYLEAAQGGLFLVNENQDDELNLVAAFAYNRKKYLEKTIKKGVGLVGTCAVEMKSINLTEIPEDYIEITSGLGEVLPTNLLLLPVMHEGQLVGVIELASLSKFKNHQIEAGENIASSLASTIISTKINSHTSQLLTKSQQQAAEMAEQEEEMRQNMEELKATQEESARREEELEGFLNAINQSFYVLEYDTRGIIQSANQKLLYFLNIPSEKVLGKTHNELFGKGSKTDNLLFAKVSEGNSVNLTEKITLKDKPIEINNTFSPLKSKEGVTLRILNIMTLNFK